MPGSLTARPWGQGNEKNEKMFKICQMDHMIILVDKEREKSIFFISKMKVLS